MTLNSYRIVSSDKPSCACRILYKSSGEMAGAPDSDSGAPSIRKSPRFVFHLAWKSAQKRRVRISVQRALRGHKDLHRKACTSPGSWHPAVAPLLVYYTRERTRLDHADSVWFLRLTKSTNTIFSLRGKDA